MSIITKPVLSVTAFEGTSLERTITAPIDTTQPDALKLAVADCLAQAKVIEESAGIELHIAALEKSQGKKLTKSQRELVTMSYNLYNGEGDAKTKPEETKETTTNEEPANETATQETQSTEGADTSPEPTGVEDEPVQETPEVSEDDPVEQAVAEQAQEEGTDVDAATQAALDALGI